MSALSPPLPLETDLTRFFWDGLRARRLLILRCSSCGHHVHYPRPVCNRCRSTDLEPAEMSGRGSIYSYTVAVQPFHPFFVDRMPYTLAVVELVEEPGLRVTTQIVDCDEADLRVGLPVEVVFTAVGDELVLPFFRPVGAAS